MDWNILISTLVGALVGGFFTLLGGAYQVHLSKKSQEKQSKRKIKLEVLTTFMGNKAAISDSPQSVDYKKDFFSAINRIPLAFNDNEEIIDLYDEFIRHSRLPEEQKARRGNYANELLYKLIKKMYEDLSIQPPTYDNFIATVY